MATQQQQQHLINVLAETPKTFNYDIPVYRTQSITVAHKQTAAELKQWWFNINSEFNQTKIDNYIPTQKEWQEWHQHYLEHILIEEQHWQEVDEWNDYDHSRDQDYSNWELDGDIDAWITLEGEEPTI